jgi:non-ribosomal peptide synthetase component E (peptide arylation enzyme)
MGERIFAAVVPPAELSPSLERLKAFLSEEQFARYKAPDQLVIVKSTPRSGDDSELRDRLRAQI